jgi:hypothetical protein
MLMQTGATLWFSINSGPSFESRWGRTLSAVSLRGSKIGRKRSRLAVEKAWYGLRFRALSRTSFPSWNFLSGAPPRTFRIDRDHQLERAGVPFDVGQRLDRELLARDGEATIVRINRSTGEETGSTPFSQREIDSWTTPMVFARPRADISNWERRNTNSGPESRAGFRMTSAAIVRCRASGRGIATAKYPHCGQRRISASAMVIAHFG